MRLSVLFSSLALLFIAVLPARAAGVGHPDLPDLVEKILPGVVNVSSTTVVNFRAFGMDDFFKFWGIPQERKQTQTSLGSGWRNAY
jgi:S1-C subfamily serine protease